MFTRKTYHHLLISLLGGLCLLLAACGEQEPVTVPVKLVVFGDSLTEGYKIGTEESVPAHLQRMFIAEGHTGVRVMNMGISGDTTQGGLARLNLALQRSPDIVLLELGANDLLRRQPADRARKNLATMIEVMQEENIRVVLAGVQVPGIFNISNPHVAEYSPMFKSLAEEYDVPFYPNFLAGVLGKSKFMQDDQLHPNSAGAQEIAERIYPLLLRVVREVAEEKS